MQILYCSARSERPDWVCRSVRCIQEATYTDKSPHHLGLVWRTHRAYDPKTGRFVERDPIDYAGGINLYAYAGNNPITKSDPSGLDTLDDASNFFAGWGDMLTFGATGNVRQRMGVDGAVDRNSGMYKGGQVVGAAHQELLFRGAGKYSRQTGRKKRHKHSSTGVVRQVKVSRQEVVRVLLGEGTGLQKEDWYSNQDQNRGIALHLSWIIWELLPLLARGLTLCFIRAFRVNSLPWWMRHGLREEQEYFKTTVIEPSK